MNSLLNKNILVTGATSGIGRCLTKKLLEIISILEKQSVKMMCQFCYVSIRMAATK